MPMSILRGIDKMLMAVESFRKRSGSYAILIDNVPVRKEFKMEHRKRSKSKLDCLPDDIPKGYLAVYVGIEWKRFVISTKYLSHQLFKELLKKSEEEFGYEQQGPLTIACEPVFFEHLLWLLGTNNPTATTTLEQELKDFYAS